MKNQISAIALLIIFTLSIACTNEDESANENPTTLFDCELNQSSDPTMSHVAICVNGSDFAVPNDTLTYVSKFDASSDASDLVILWTVASGNMEILNVENSNVDGLKKSIATIQFKANFSGGQINVRGEDNITNEFVTFTYPIEFGN